MKKFGIVAIITLCMVLAFGAAYAAVRGYWYYNQVNRYDIATKVACRGYFYPNTSSQEMEISFVGNFPHQPASDYYCEGDTGLYKTSTGTWQTVHHVAQNGGFLPTTASLTIGFNYSIAGFKYTVNGSVLDNTMN